MAEESGADGPYRRRRTALTWLAVFVVPIALGSAAALTLPRDAGRSPAGGAINVLAASSGTPVPPLAPLPHGGPLAALLLKTRDLPEHAIALPDCCFYEDPIRTDQDDDSCDGGRSHPATRGGQTAQRSVPIRFTQPDAAAGVSGSQVLTTYSSPASAAAAVAAYRDFLNRCQVVADGGPGPHPSDEVLKLRLPAVGDESLRSETRIGPTGSATRSVSYLSMIRTGATMQQITVFRAVSGAEQHQLRRAGDLALLGDLEMRGLRKISSASASPNTGAVTFRTRSK